MSKMDSFFNLSPLNTTVSRKVISFSDISAVNLMVGCNLLACSIIDPRPFCHCPRGRRVYVLSAPTKPLSEKLNAF